ncbi:MAG: hypothetical protein QOJ99_4430 [Bryobacterales bacterium]|nr:hypothetical protein [Bryobacterales bacterium]
MVPLSGALSDRIGRRPILIVCSLLAVLTAYPALAWAVASPSFFRLLIVELWLSFMYGGYNGALIVYLTEMMPPQVRASGFSLAYSLATALFGGFTPYISTWLIDRTSNRAIAGAWLTFAALTGLIAILVANRTSHEPAEAAAAGIHAGYAQYGRPDPDRLQAASPIAREAADDASHCTSFLAKLDLFRGRWDPCGEDRDSPCRGRERAYDIDSGCALPVEGPQSRLALELP